MLSNLKKVFIPPVLMLISVAFMTIFHFLLRSFNLISFPFNLFGIAVSVGGFTIMGKARELFKKHETNLAIEKSSYLITEGIFSKTRNPMYIGMFLLLTGVGICFMNIISILVPFGFLLVVRLLHIPNEESLLERTFGKDYLSYKNKVRRWI